jgi:SAM-dependent methyltransferase
MSRISHCPFCGFAGGEFYASDRKRDYLSCLRCQLVFVPPCHYLSAEQERAEYDLHDNNVEDPGYRRFLSRLAQPLVSRLPPGASGLDFGCGPGPALAAMLTEQGLRVALYDIFYAPDPEVLQHSYDFVCATEVVEHLHSPGEELARLWQMIKPGGWLGIMTKLVLSPQAFAQWHYKNDPTHVCFFSEATWRWWASEMAAELVFEGSDVILLGKPA